MSRKLRWTPESERTLNQNIEYLAEGWDNQVIHNFLDRIEDVLEQIRIDPELYSLHRSEIRSINVLFISGSFCITK